MLMKKNALAFVVMSAFAITACQPKVEKKAEPTEEQQPASVVEDTTLKLQGGTQKVAVVLPECNDNRCLEFSIDRLQTNQTMVDQQIDRAILQNLERILDIGNLKQDIQAEKDKQSPASVVTAASGTDVRLTPAQMMAEQIKPYVSAFSALDQELKTLGASSQINLSIRPKILNSEGALVTTVLNTVSYLGGAHGSSSQTYYNFDLEKQKIVVLDDIVLADQKAQLEKLVYEAFKKWVIDSQLSTNIAEYEQVWKFKLTDNYYLGKNGLILQYGEYEIGPYVAGLPRLEIPYTQLNSILKKEYLPNHINADQQQAASTVSMNKDKTE